MKILVEECCLLIIDVQEKLIPLISNKNEIIQTSLDLIDIAKNLKIPILLTEQYPKGLGKTIKQIRDLIPENNSYIFEKTSFSCLGSSDFEKALKRLKKKQVIIAGIESHICVMQTVLDLKKINYDVFIVREGIGSRKVEDNKLSINRMLSQKVFLTNIEMLIFELVRDSNHSLFKYFSKKYVK